eukprot:312677-Prorocentrum_minimum.AAC.2
MMPSRWDFRSLSSELFYLSETVYLHRAGAAGGVTAVQLLLVLVSRHSHLLGVDDNYVATHVDGRGVCGQVGATQVVGNNGRETAQSLALK